MHQGLVISTGISRVPGLFRKRVLWQLFLQLQNLVRGLTCRECSRDVSEMDWISQILPLAPGAGFPAEASRGDLISTGTRF